MKKIEAKFARLRESYVKKTDAFVFAVLFTCVYRKKVACYTFYLS